MGQLDGRVALVTGAGRGIGRAIARELARSGAQLVISSRTRDDLDAVVKEIDVEGGVGKASVADALDRRQARNLVQFALAEFGGLDIVVNNVGGSVPPRSLDSDDEDDAFLADVTLNLLSAVWTSRAALPAMREKGYGRIINIGSGASKHAGGSLAYTTAKHGLVGFTRQLAADTAKQGVTVNCLCPGWTNTSLVDWESMSRRMGITPDEARAYAESSSLQERVLEAEELGPMAVLLASPAGGGITGQVISVDGGYKV